MTSDPAIHPANPQKPLETVIKPSYHSPRHTEDTTPGYTPQSAMLQAARSTVHQNVTSGHERISQARFTDTGGRGTSRSHDTGIEPPKGIRDVEGRGHTHERSAYGFSGEGRAGNIHNSDVARSQHSDTRRYEGTKSDYIEVDGMHYIVFQEPPSKGAEANMERPKEVKVAERRAHMDEELVVYRSNKDRQYRASTSDAVRSQYYENQPHAGMGERSHYRSHMEVGDTRYARHQEQAPRGSESLDNLHKTLQTYEREKRDMIATTNNAIMKAEKAERRIGDLEAQLERQSEELRMTVNQLRQAEALRQQTLELLETKTSELRGAQAFMPKEDSLSGADVIGMVKSLNAEILQVAAFMADSLEDLGKAQRGDTETMHAQRAVSLGKYIIRALRSRKEGTEFDPMPVQIALQVSLVNTCKRVVEGWVPGVPQNDLIFDAIYARVRETEGQSISGRWRAMTRCQIRNLVGKDTFARVMGIIMGDVMEVFIIAGYSTRDLKKHKYFDKFQERLEAIGRLAYRIQEAIGEGLTSDDFRISVISDGESFDPTIMDDTFLPNESAVIGERVAGTTDFGLSIQSTTTTPTILKKPKVVLASAL